MKKCVQCGKEIKWYNSVKYFNKNNVKSVYDNKIEVIYTPEDKESYVCRDCYKKLENEEIEKREELVKKLLENSKGRVLLQEITREENRVLGIIVMIILGMIGLFFFIIPGIIFFIIAGVMINSKKRRVADLKLKLGELELEHKKDKKHKPHLSILKERYASGKISKKDFEDIKKDLE